jgi:hypothetical protein
MWRYAGCLAIAFTVMACGGKRGTAATETPAPETAAASNRATTRREANLVTGDEIRAHGGNNLQDILQSLRPAWFRIRATRVAGLPSDPVTVYLDGRRVGTVSALRDIPVPNVSVVRYYSASEAQSRYGMGNMQGSIEVTTNR